PVPLAGQPRHRLHARNAGRGGRRLLPVDDRRRLRRRRQRPAGSPMRLRAALVALALVAVLVIGNVVAYGHNAQADLSAARRFSLAPQTSSVIRQVKSPLKVTAFLNSTGSEARDARFLLDRYHELNRRITFSVLDPDADPGAARRFGVTRYSTVIVT